MHMDPETAVCISSYIVLRAQAGLPGYVAQFTCAVCCDAHGKPPECRSLVGCGAALMCSHRKPFHCKSLDFSSVVR